MTPSSSSADRPGTDDLRVRSYLAALPPEARRALRQVRDAIRIAVPGTVDGFGYGMPALKLHGQTLLWYAGWKHHISLYPVTEAVKHTFAAELDRYETSKGTVRFPLDEPPPLALVKRLAKARVAELRAKKAKA